MLHDARTPRCRRHDPAHNPHQGLALANSAVYILAKALYPLTSPPRNRLPACTNAKNQLHECMCCRPGCKATWVSSSPIYAFVQQHTAPSHQKTSPASQFRGLSAAGALNKAKIAWHTLCKVHAGLQAVLRISKQISPVCKMPSAPDCQRRPCFKMMVCTNN